METITIFIISFLIVAIPAILFLIPFAFGAPFQPTSEKQLKNILSLSKIKKGEKIADLGSGDGRIVIEFAKKGAEAHGYEINPLLVFLSRRKIKKSGLHGKAFIHWKNFWKENLGKYDVITLFQVGYVMKKLGEKLKKEAKKKIKVVSHFWKFPQWKPKKIKGDVFYYEIQRERKFR